jgi:hypothetical protein
MFDGIGVQLCKIYHNVSIGQIIERRIVEGRVWDLLLEVTRPWNGDATTFEHTHVIANSSAAKHDGIVPKDFP